MECEYSGTSIFLTNFLFSYGMRMQASISTDDLRLDKGDDTDWRATDWPTAGEPRLLPPTTLRCGRRARPGQLLAYHYNWSVHDNTIITCSDRWWTEKLSRNTAPTLFTYVPYCFLCSILLLLFDVMCSAHLYSSVSAYSLAQLLSLRTPAAARMLGAGCGGKEH